MFWLSAKQWAMALVISSLAVLAPIKSILLAVLVLVLADFVLGVAVAIKEHKLLTSTGFRRTISKILAYQIVIAMGYLCSVYLVPEIPFGSIIAGAVGMAELKSLLENAAILTQNPLFLQIDRVVSGRWKELTRDKE